MSEVGVYSFMPFLGGWGRTFGLGRAGVGGTLLGITIVLLYLTKMAPTVTRFGLGGTIKKTIGTTGTIALASRRVARCMGRCVS